MKKSVATGQRTRQQISREAARLMAEEGVVDHQSAKSKAVERLSLSDQSGLPDNREIEHALLDYLELFQGQELDERRLRWRRTARDLMRLLKLYDPQLTGATLSGTLSRFSHIQILVHTSPESVSIFLDEEEMPFEQGQRRSRRSTNDYVYLPTFRFLIDEINIELICIESLSLSRSLLCPIDGGPMKRAGYKEVDTMVSESETNKTL